MVKLLNDTLDKLWVVIPVGGTATRLLPLTYESSKACLRLANRPMIELSILCLASQGVKNFVFGVKGYTNYRSLHDHFESGTGFSAVYGIKPPIHIKYQPNVDDFGSGDSARINLEYYDINDTLFAVQGDNIFDVDLKRFMDFHTAKNGVLTIGLMEVKDATGLGVADVDENMRITQFVEKPTSPGASATSKLVNTGLYMFSREIRSILKEEGIQKIVREKKRLDFGYDVIPYLIETGREVYGFRLSGSWFDVGTPKRYLDAVAAILNGKLSSLQDFGGRISAKERIWIQGDSAESSKERESIVKKFRDGRIQFQGSVLIGRHCEIEDGARIANSCIDNYSRIGRNAVIENSAVMDRAIIGDSAVIKDSIVGRHVTVNSNPQKPTYVGGLSVIADDVSVTAGCRLSSSKVYPHLRLPEGNFEKMTVKRIEVDET